jgi:hypothetical protein
VEGAAATMARIAPLGLPLLAVAQTPMVNPTMLPPINRVVAMKVAGAIAVPRARGLLREGL